jgi:hypothetical protein
MGRVVLSALNYIFFLLFFCQSYHIHLVDPVICLLRPDPTKEKRLPPFTVKTSSRTSQGETNILHADSGCAYTNGLHIWVHNQLMNLCMNIPVVETCSQHSRETTDWYRWYLQQRLYDTFSSLAAKPSGAEHCRNVKHLTQRPA